MPIAAGPACSRTASPAPNAFAPSAATALGRSLAVRWSLCSQDMHLPGGVVQGAESWAGNGNDSNLIFDDARLIHPTALFPAFFTSQVAGERGRDSAWDPERGAAFRAQAKPAEEFRGPWPWRNLPGRSATPEPPTLPPILHGYSERPRPVAAPEIADVQGTCARRSTAPA